MQYFFLEENVDSPRGKVLIIAISITGIVFGLMIFGLGYMAFRLKLMKKVIVNYLLKFQILNDVLKK